MASVFLSYDRDDSAAAKIIAIVLEKAGHSVWWDLHVRGGAQFSKVIEGALKAADSVVVLWSANSIESAWVRDEAAVGRDSGRLVPASIDGTEAPLGFRQFQTVDLADWKRGTNSRGHEELLQSIAECAGESSRLDHAVELATSQKHGRAQIGWLQVSAIAIVLVGAVAVGLWRFSGRYSSVPVVSVVPADSSPSDQALARDLFVKLGSIWSVRTEAVRLSDEGGGHPSFIMQAAGNSVALLSGNDRSLLWSKDFDAEGTNRTGLEQSMAYTTGKVLDCALQADAVHTRLDEQTLKSFLNGCSQFADDYHFEPAAVVPILSQVVAKAPRFEPAWRKLLLADTLVARNEQMFEDRFAPGRLGQDIAAARKLNPNMPEIYVAETEMLPLNAYAKRLELLDRAARLDPNNADVLISRAVHLDAVGRINDEFEDANRAVDIDPLSASLRSILIYGLANAGKLPAAEQQLRSAEELWPGAPTIQDAVLRVNMLYGDPRRALEILNSDTKRRQDISPTVEAYLAARLDSSPANVQRAIDAASGPHLTNSTALALLIQMLGQFHRESEIYDLLLAPRWASSLGGMSQIYFRTTLHGFRQDPRFMQVAARAGLIDYWRKSGKWPDFCFEPDLPYDCKKEAAKLGA